MSEWFKKLIQKNIDTCVFCEKTVDKKTVYTITMDTADGAHTIKACEPCALDFDKILKDIEDARNDFT